MASVKEREADFLRYPGFKTLYMKAFGEMLKNMTRATTWKTAEDVFGRWMYGINRGNRKAEDGGE